MRVEERRRSSDLSLSSLRLVPSLSAFSPPPSDTSPLSSPSLPRRSSAAAPRPRRPACDRSCPRSRSPAPRATQIRDSDAELSTEQSPPPPASARMRPLRVTRMRNSDARLRCMTQMRDSDARLGCVTRMRDSDARLGCVTRMCDSDVRLGCATRMRDSDA